MLYFRYDVILEQVLYRQCTGMYKIYRNIVLISIGSDKGSHGLGVTLTLNLAQIHANAVVLVE